MLRISNRLISSGVRKAMANTNSATATSRSFHRNIACVNLHLKSELRSSLAPFSARNRFNAIRSLSSNTNKDDPASKKHPDQENRNEHELVLTPGQKVVAGTRLTLWASAFVFGSFCLYYIVKELLPTKLSPNSIFSKATDVVTNSAEVKRRFGEPLKCYGRDHGGHREGRRNFIEHTEYKDKDDGSTRVRVRFNLEGKYGAAFVFCEVSSQMDSGEFVYLLVQDKRNGMVITLVDNRSRLLAERMGGGSQAGRQAFGNLLGGGVGQQK